MKKISPCCGKIDCVYNEYCKCRLFTQSSAKPNIELDDHGRCDRFIQKFESKSINFKDYSNEFYYCPVCAHTEFKTVEYDSNEYLYCLNCGTMIRKYMFKNNINTYLNGGEA